MIVGQADKTNRDDDETNVEAGRASDYESAIERRAKSELVCRK